jgi:hypothetical protein
VSKTILVITRSEAMKRPLETISRENLGRYLDAGIRHKSGSQPHDYLEHWLWIMRQFGYATHDDSWGELEKELAIMVSRLIRAERKLESMGIKIEDL